MAELNSMSAVLLTLALPVEKSSKQRLSLWL
jgi:hypothetical protein